MQISFLEKIWVSLQRILPVVSFLFFCWFLRSGLVHDHVGHMGIVVVSVLFAWAVKKIIDLISFMVVMFAYIIYIE